MKYVLPALVLVFLFFSGVHAVDAITNVPPVGGSSPVPSPNCLGSCPTVGPSLSPSTSSPSTVPSTTVSTHPSTTIINPSTAPSTVPVISSAPCTTSQSVVSSQSTGSAHASSQSKKHISGAQGFLQQFIQFLLQLLQLLFQQLGINFPIPGAGSPCPTPSTAPSSTPSLGVSPVTSQSPSSAQPSSTPSSAPSSGSNPTPTIFNASPSPSNTPVPSVAGTTPVPQKPSASCAPATQQITVNGVQWVRTSNNWGGANACLNAWDGKSVSYLIQSQSAKPSGGVMGYPDLSQGCNFGGGGCTANWTSKQISALTAPKVTWVTSQSGAVAGSKYDTGADLWFSSNPKFTDKTAEVLIALNSQGEPPNTSKQVMISGVPYYFYIVPQHGWNEIIFFRVQQVSSVTNLALLPFFQYIVSQNLEKSSDYWVNASFGNEIWQAGTGLQVNSLSLTE